MNHSQHNETRLSVRMAWAAAIGVSAALTGSAVVLFPATLLRVAGINSPGAVPLVQVIGMMVGVYAYGYYLLAREPKRYYGLIWIALAGKTFGPVGFVYSASTSALPWSFGWICLFNDVIWWPVFWRFALEHAREHGARRD